MAQWHKGEGSHRRCFQLLWKIFTFSKCPKMQFGATKVKNIKVNVLPMCTVLLQTFLFKLSFRWNHDPHCILSPSPPPPSPFIGTVYSGIHYCDTIEDSLKNEELMFMQCVSVHLVCFFWMTGTSAWILTCCYCCCYQPSCCSKIMLLLWWPPCEGFHPSA